LTGFKITLYLVDETPSYGVAYKPPGMHSVPLKGLDADMTALDWCAGFSPEVKTVIGKNPWEGGIIHRLDYETQGLILFAKTQEALERLYVYQREGRFVKEYSALSGLRQSQILPGFPPPPRSTIPGVIASGFRSFGPGRQAVRPTLHPPGGKQKPVLDQGNPYCTEVLETRASGIYRGFRLRIKRGFRHQIRCHLAWAGFPLLNDPLYGGATGQRISLGETSFSTLALIAYGLFFPDPVSGESRRYVIPHCYSFFPPCSPIEQETNCNVL
jgi:23S rRNA pseudouridine1911/1915/1917 synthase